MPIFDLLPQRREDWASLLIVFIALLVGVPLWLITTTVKRASLPLAKINEFSDIDETLIYFNDEEKMMLMPVATSVEVLLILAVAEPNATRLEWDCGSAMECKLNLMFARTITFTTVVTHLCMHATVALRLAISGHRSSLLR